MSLNDNLRAARLAVHKTQEQVAREADMHVTQYNGYERGRSRPAPATMERLAVALETTVDALEAEPVAPIEAPAATGARTLTRLKTDLAEYVAGSVGVSAQQVVIKIEIQ